MRNLKAFAKANETLTKEALLTVKGGDDNDKVGGKSYNVINDYYKFYQEVDATGRSLAPVDQVKK